MSRVPYNSIYQKDGKTLTAYGLACGYLQSNIKFKGVEYLAKGYKELYREHSVYHVRTSKESGNIWQSFETLSEARKFYNSIKL